MPTLPRVLGAALLLFSALARAEAPTVQGTKDKRFFVVDSELMVDASSMDRSFTAVDTQGGKIERFGYISNNCMTGDGSMEGAEDASVCRKKQQRISTDYELGVTRWRKAHVLVDLAPKRQGPGGATIEVKSPSAKVTASDSGFKLEFGKAAPTDSVFTVVKAGRPAHSGSARYGDEVALDVYWSEGGQWAFVAPGTDVRGPQLTIVAGVAQIDLLDAGAGSAVAAVAGKLQKAGFAPTHQGKAGSPHPRTEIFFAPGFEADAQAIATALGAAKDAIKPLGWVTPYAITVAAAKQ